MYLFNVTSIGSPSSVFVYPTQLTLIDCIVVSASVNVRSFLYELLSSFTKIVIEHGYQQGNDYFAYVVSRYK